MITGSDERNFRIYDLKRPEGDQHVITFINSPTFEYVGEVQHLGNY